MVEALERTGLHPLWLGRSYRKETTGIQSGVRIEKRGIHIRTSDYARFNGYVPIPFLDDVATARSGDENARTRLRAFEQQPVQFHTQPSSAEIRVALPPLEQYLSGKKIQEGRYAFYRPSIDALFTRLFDLVIDPKPLHQIDAGGFLLHGPYGTGKTEFVHNFANRLQDAGHPVNLFCVTDEYFGNDRVARLKYLFRAAEDIAQRTGRRSIVLWENPEAQMAHKFRVVEERTDTYSESRGSHSITERALQPGHQDAIQMTSLLETILSGGATPLSKTLLICTTNHLDSIDPALLRPGRLTTVEFPLIYDFEEKGRAGWGSNKKINIRSLLYLFTIVAAQSRRIGDYDKDMNVESLLASLDVISSQLDLIISSLQETPGRDQTQDYDKVRESAKQAGILLPIESYLASFATPQKVFKALTFILSKIPKEKKASWGTEQTSALITCLYLLSKGVEGLKIIEISYPPGMIVQSEKNRITTLKGYYSDPLGFSFKDCESELGIVLTS